MQILGMLLSIVSLVCFIIVVIDAFKSAIWKGLVSFFCFIYWIYYAFVEFQHDKKWPIVIAGLLCGVTGGALSRM